MANRTLTEDLWHFPRPALAKEYLRAFDVGLVSARALFAKRRMGKSEFLEQDLMPEARRQGYLIAYLNLWDARTHPATALAQVLHESLARPSVKLLRRSLKGPVKSVKASAKVGHLAEATIEAELAHETAAGAAQVIELIRGFTKPKKRLLLVLDEAQVLAMAAHSDLAHSLRAALDSRKANIKVMFAGSSEATLRRMFGRYQEPFYNWAPLEPFELLGASFVRAMVERVKVLSRFPLSLKEALHAYEALGRTPEFFRRFLDRYLAYAPEGAKAALEYTLSHVYNDSAYQSAWAALQPVDRKVLKLLVAGTAEIYSQEARMALAKFTGVEKPVGAHVAQNAIKRLVALEIIVQFERGEYRVLDDAFGDWVRRQLP